MEPMYVLALAVFAMLQASLFCNTVYLHRFVTHHSIVSRSPVFKRMVELMHLWLAVMTGLNSQKWMGLHVNHHDYTKVDPYNPSGKNQWHVFFNTWRYYGKGRAEPNDVADYDRDWVDRLPAFLRYRGLSGLKLCIWVGVWARHGSWHGLLYGFGAWGLHLLFFTVVFSLLNAFAHEGGAEAGGKNRARNIWWLLFIAWGEGWHQSHHDCPGSAQFALLDPAWLFFIKPAEVLGLVTVRPLAGFNRLTLKAKAAE